MTAIIDEFLGVPPASKKRNQFTIPGEAERRRQLKLAERRGAWAAAWFCAWVEIACHMQVPCGTCEGCRANGLVRR